MDSDRDKEILARADWIWPNGNLYLVNCFARFRHDFVLAEVPSEAPLLITADKAYRLHVNGRHAARGPARGYQEHWPYDKVDIRDFLRPGRNHLSVEAYTPGIGTFSYIHRAKAGFLCAAEWSGGTRLATNAETWRIARSTAHNPRTARLTKQLDFQEDFDAARDDRRWIDADEFDPSWFHQPVWAAREYAAPFGQPPYDDVEARGIPPLRETLSPPRAVTSRGEGPVAPGYREAENIAWFFNEEEHPSMRYRTAAESPRTEGDFLLAELPAAGRGRAVSATFDLGEEWLPGTLLIEVDGGAAGGIVDVFHHQYLPAGFPEFTPPGVGSLIAIASRLRLAEGRSRHEFFHVAGARQFTVLARENARPLRLRLSWRSAVYPLDIAGDFRCSDPLLNDIRRIGVHTQRACSLDAFVDTPWREQGQWWGDARIQAKNVHYLAGDPRLLRRGVRSIAGQENRHGLTYGLAPTASGSCILPDFSVTWILTVFDHWFQTGDLELFHEQRGRIEGILAYFESTRLSNGLLPNDRRFWYFGDWADLPRTGCPCLLNTWHLYGLVHYLRLLRAAGDAGAARAGEIADQIARARTRLKEAYFDAEAGLFRPTVDGEGEGERTGTPSCHDQVMAVLLGLAPEARESMVAQRLLPVLTGSSVEGATPSAFWSSYLLDAARMLGLRREGIGFIRRMWARMVLSGTTWEVFDLGDYPWSQCHAWSAHPVTHLPDLLTGLIQLAPGWSELSFEPMAPEDMDHASAVIPTPRGLLSGAWRRGGGRLHFRLEAPEGVAVRMRLPGQAEETVEGGVHVRVLPETSA